MYVQLLEARHGKDLGSAAQLVDGISAATGHARELIRGLLEYSRAGRGELRKERLHVDRVVNEALDVLAGTIEEAGAAVEVGDMPVVRADHRNLIQVFQNLISNAVKFSDGDPHVKVSAERVESAGGVAGSDHGIGMEPSQAGGSLEALPRLHRDGGCP